MNDFITDLLGALCLVVCLVGSMFLVYGFS